MLEVLRNMLRRKMRTFLTIFGIVIGVFALTVMGSMSEYFNVMLERAMKFSGSSVSVRPKEAGFMPGFGQGTVRRLERVSGVKAVIPKVLDALEEFKGSIRMGMQDMVIGVPPKLSRLSMEPVPLQKGRWLERGDTYEVVIGHKIAQKKGLDLGDKLTWKKKEFTVVGIMERTETFPDQLAIMPIETVRRLMKQPDVIHGIIVVPEDPSQGDALAERINRAVPDVEATPPGKAIEDVRKTLLIFNVIMLSGAVMAVVVGGLAVINTMVMSVHERTREIGVKKAVGAEDFDILAEYVTEAALIGFVGGLIGLILGWGMANFLNETVAKEIGGEIFTVTPRLAMGALVFSVVLGMVAGLYPAWRAARLDPVMALRTE